ncbi:hypothetical protein STEG23_002152, partial [Scotinomys teguina]
PQQLLPPFHAPLPIDMRHQEGRYHYDPHSVHGVHGPPTLSGSPVISDISLIRLSPHPAGPGESPFSAHHPYVNPHMEHYLRSVHSSPTLSMISAARGLSPADVAHEHLKERGLFGLAAPATNPSDYYHQMTLMASHPTPYGDLLMQSGGAASAPHLHDYLSPVDALAFMSGDGGTGQRREHPRGFVYPTEFTTESLGEDLLLHLALSVEDEPNTTTPQQGEITDLDDVGGNR